MKLSGSYMLHASPQQIFDSMQDPRFLVRTIPGCQQLEVTGEDEYQMTITAGVASIKGTYLGSVRMLDPQPPEAYTLRASANSAVGTVDADARITLHVLDGEGTELRYDADAKIGGTIAGVGQRMLTGVAKKMAGEFFAAGDRVLGGVPAGAAPAAGATLSAGAALSAAEAPAAQAGAAAAAPATTPAAAAPAGAAAAGAAPAGPPRMGQVFRRPAPPPRAPAPAPGWLGVLAGAALGAAAALIGVALGARAARRD